MDVFTFKECHILWELIYVPSYGELCTGIETHNQWTYPTATELCSISKTKSLISTIIVNGYFYQSKTTIATCESRAAYNPSRAPEFTPRVLMGLCRSLGLCIVFCRSSFVRHRFTDSEYPFGTFKLFLSSYMQFNTSFVCAMRFMVIHIYNRCICNNCYPSDSTKLSLDISSEL